MGRVVRSESPGQPARAWSCRSLDHVLPFSWFGFEEFQPVFALFEPRPFFFDDSSWRLVDEAGLGKKLLRASNHQARLFEFTLQITGLLLDTRGYDPQAVWPDNRRRIYGGGRSFAANLRVCRGRSWGEVYRAGGKTKGGT